MTLAETLRPTTLTDIIGQDHLTAEGGLLHQAVKNKRPFSCILYGPPGTGKTSIASSLANDFGVQFEEFNASVDDKKKLQTIIKKLDNGPVLLLLDEIHRLDKPKQDYLLPNIEKRGLIVVGATTENPFISINPALRSRMTLLQVKALNSKDLEKLILKGIDHLKQELDTDISIADETLKFLASHTAGDVRSALNALELAIDNGVVSQNILEQLLGGKVIQGDKDGNEHYNLLSAFQKSIRGSDANAAIHYLARLIQIGDLESICRRLSIIAYEDIGVADQGAVINANLAIQVAKQTGLPEARIPLANAVVELALANKSNMAYKALDAALMDLQSATHPIPMHLRDAHFKGADQLGHEGYQYPHDHKHHFIPQQYLPDTLIGRRYLHDDNPTTDAVTQKLKKANGISALNEKR